MTDAHGLLRALGFDPDSSEIAEARRAETLRDAAIRQGLLMRRNCNCSNAAGIVCRADVLVHRLGWTWRWLCDWHDRNIIDRAAWREDA